MEKCSIKKVIEHINEILNQQQPETYISPKWDKFN